MTVYFQEILDFLEKHKIEELYSVIIILFKTCFKLPVFLMRQMVSPYKLAYISNISGFSYKQSKAKMSLEIFSEILDKN